MLTLFDFHATSRRLAVRHRDQNGQGWIELRTLAGQRLGEIPNEYLPLMPHWSPDGARVAFFGNDGRLYVHLNRVIRERDLEMLYVTGPGHGGPALVAQAYLEGTYSEVYRDISEDREGMRKLFKQFSFPGGIPSHVAPETPGSIHEGGELGYALSHAFGAAFDNPDLIVACVVGDGEAETGPAATGSTVSPST